MIPDLESQIHEIGRRARAAGRALARLSSHEKNAVLQSMADELLSAKGAILAANEEDVRAGEGHGLSLAMLDRLRLSEKRLVAMADGIRQVATLPDPVGETLRDWTREDGLHFTKVRTPIGVIGIIYESRPNVTSDAAVLCIKTGNAVILRGGSESIHSNKAIAAALQAGGEKGGMPRDAVQLIPTTDRDAVRIMAGMDAYLDMIVPRGGHALIEAVVQHARMPVIKHYHGVCIAYVDRDADPEMALQIVQNGKMQRPGVCNALETVLVHRDIAESFLPEMARVLEGVELRGDLETVRILGDRAVAVSDADWTTEYLDLILAVRVVGNLDEAVAHIETHGSHHSDVIITRDAAAAAKFLREVDSATVYWNASTRFTDGGEFGFGAEIGISTDKLHARGPMALEELTTYKYVIYGNGQIRT